MNAVDPVLSEIWRHAGRSTRVVVDLDAIAQNVQAVRRHVAPADVMAVVKANAYGHGSVAVAREALSAGAAMLGVGTVDEARRLRSHGIDQRIQILGPIDDSEISTAIEMNVELSVGDRDSAECVIDRALAAGQRASVHLKIDTGMHRFGCAPDEAEMIATLLAASPYVHLAGIFSHLACADSPDSSSALDQIDRFTAITGAIRGHIDQDLRLHIANTASAIRWPRSSFDMVRLGIGLYGLPPGRQPALLPHMRPALQIVSRLRRVTHLQTGDSVSYGATYRASRQERIGLVPLGYGDGYGRALSNRGWMALHGERAPIRGRVCMDQTIVGLPDGRDVVANDVVVVVGNGRDGAPTIADIAEIMGTNAYETVTSLATRLPRFYVRNGQVIAVDELNSFRDVT